MGRSRWIRRAGCRTAWFVSPLLLVSFIFVLSSQPLFAEMDEEWPLSSIAREVPTFGGMYVDRPTLYVWLTDGGQSLDAAVEAIRRNWPTDKFENFTPVALRAKYSFLQLDAWHEQMDGVLSIDGAIYTDRDERNNRLTAEVEDLAAQGPAVEAELKRVGVPLAAVDIIQEEPILQAPALPTSPSPAPRPSPSHRAEGRLASNGSSGWVAPGLVSAMVALVSFLAIRSRRRSRLDNGRS